MAVIRPYIETDPAELEQIALRFLEAGLDGWEPAAGDLMSWLISAHARMVAEERDIAADVPLEQILRPLGEQVHRITPHAASAATVTALVTMRDDAGYTVPAGMEVLVRTAGDDGVTMVVSRTVTVEPDDLTGTVELRAAGGREGTGGNGLSSGAVVVPIRSYEFIERIELTDTSRGGRDAETDEEYFQRLVDTLALTSPAPILLEDFAGIARQHPSVKRALAFDRYLSRGETIEVAGTGPAAWLRDASDGRILLPQNGTAADVAETFAVYSANPISGGPLGTAPVVLSLGPRESFGPWWAEPGAGSTASVTVLAPGGQKHPVERAVAVAVINERGDGLIAAERDEVREMLEKLREVNWMISVIAPDYRPIDVRFNAVAWQGYDPALVEAAALAALETYLSPANWGLGERRGDGVNVTWVDEPIVRYLEVAQVLNEVSGLRHVTDLWIGLEGRTLTREDVELVGLAALPRAGANISGTVVEQEA